MVSNRGSSGPLSFSQNFKRFNGDAMRSENEIGEAINSLKREYADREDDKFPCFCSIVLLEWVLTNDRTRDMDEQLRDIAAELGKELHPVF